MVKIFRVGKEDIFAFSYSVLFRACPVHLLSVHWGIPPAQLNLLLFNRGGPNSSKCSRLKTKKLLPTEQTEGNGGEF
jgi:hypothetical protein